MKDYMEKSGIFNIRYHGEMREFYQKRKKKYEALQYFPAVLVLQICI